MRNALLGLATAVAMLTLASTARSEEPKDPGPAGPAAPAEHAKAMFQKMDADKDGKLTLDEFTKAMESLHKTMMEQGGPRGPMRGGPMGPPPMGPGMMPPWMPGPDMMRGPMPPRHGHGPCPNEGERPAMQPAGGPPMCDVPKDGKALEARVKELEAAVKALQAKLEAK